MTANSRTATPRTRATRTPRELAPAEVEPENDFDDEDVSPAAAQETEATATSDGYITVPMTGADGDTEDMRVLLSSKWRSSAMRAINNGDFDTFMKAVLFEDDYDVYLDLDPETAEVEAFATAVVTATGETLGKSSGSNRSSKSTRRR